MSVSKEASGTYTVQVWYRDWEGSRRKKTKRGFRTKKEASRWEANFISKCACSPDMSFKAFCDIYEADRRPHLKLNTWRTKEHIIGLKIIPFFGEKKLSEISSSDILRWQTELMKWRDKHGKGYSSTYLRTVSSQLASIFNHAVRYYGLPASPVAKVARMGSTRSGEMQFWTKEEYLRFADSMMNKPLSYLAFEILYWMGIREGELLALTPKSFNLEKRLLSITESYQRIDGEDVVTSPKTPKSVRVIAISDFFADEVEDYLSIYGCESAERIFRVSKSYLYHEMERGCKASGVKRIRIHDLRHSHVSLLIDLGFNALAIADRMGHESVDITFRYAHLFPIRQAQMAEALDMERKVAHEWEKS